MTARTVRHIELGDRVYAVFMNLNDEGEWTPDPRYKDRGTIIPGKGGRSSWVLWDSGESDELTGCIVDPSVHDVPARIGNARYGEHYPTRRLYVRKLTIPIIVQQESS